MHSSNLLFLVLGTAGFAHAHTGAWAPGMYCRGGNDTTKDDQNTNLVVNPLYMLSKTDFWFQHDRGCDKVPPPTGEFLNLPANGEFTAELAHNRASTTLSYDGKFVTDWPDGKTHPEDWNGGNVGEGCIQDDGALHVQNETAATGSAFAISYQSDLSKVTLENLVVFTVLEHTPWKRIATYKVPNLPACPPDGCSCAWLWVPKGCGQPNVYMQGFKCKVTNAVSTTPLAPAVPPTYCKGDSTKCTKGAKQMIIWNQAEGNNVFPPSNVSPAYNENWGWPNGAQNDIFAGTAVSATSSAAVSTSNTKSSTGYQSSSSSFSPIAKQISTSSPSGSKSASAPVSYTSSVYIPSSTHTSFITVSARPSSLSSVPILASSVPINAVVSSNTASSSFPSSSGSMTTFSTKLSSSTSASSYGYVSSSTVSAPVSPSPTSTGSDSDEERLEKLREWFEMYWGRGKWFKKSRAH